MKDHEVAEYLHDFFGGSDSWLSTCDTFPLDAFSLLLNALSRFFDGFSGI